MLLYNNARIAVEYGIGLGSSARGDDISFTSSAFQVLQLAVEECRRDRTQSFVGTEHLLLSLI